MTARQAVDTLRGWSPGWAGRREGDPGMAKVQDPQSEILVALLRARRPLTVGELVERTGAADSTVRANLGVMSREVAHLEPWVREGPLHLRGSKVKRYVLTDRGTEVARYRARGMRRG